MAHEELCAPGLRKGGCHQQGLGSLSPGTWAQVAGTGPASCACRLQQSTTTQPPAGRPSCLLQLTTLHPTARQQSITYIVTTPRCAGGWRDARGRVSRLPLQPLAVGTAVPRLPPGCRAMARPSPRGWRFLQAYLPVDQWPGCAARFARKPIQRCAAIQRPPPPGVPGWIMI